MINQYLADITIGRIEPGSQGSQLVSGATPINTFADVLSTAIAILSVVAGIYFLFIIITSGIAIMSSGDDPQKVAGARNRITYGIVGLIIVFASTVVISLVAWIFGIDNPLDITNLINNAGVPATD